MVLVRFLLQNGVGQNITAGAIGLILGWLWARAKLRALHAHLDASHLALHKKLDTHAKQHAAAIEALHQRISQDRRDAGAKPPRPRAPRKPKP